MALERKEGHFAGHDGKEIEMYQVTHTDGKRHPSVIVVHEIGLIVGLLGFAKK